MGDAELRDRVNANLRRGRRSGLRARCRRSPSALGARRRGGLPEAAGGGTQGAEGAQDRAVLRLPDPPALACARLRGPGQPLVARADHRGLRRRGGRLSGEAQVLRVPDHPGARGDGARRAGAADRAGDRGRGGRDRDPCPLCHLSLDAWQSKLTATTGRDFGIPIRDLSQLIGVAAGISESSRSSSSATSSRSRPVLEKLEH